MQNMATSVANTVRDIGNSAAGAVEGAVSNKKIADLEKNKKNQHDTKQNTTTDWGAKVSDVDHWLKIVDEKGNRVGPSLLEDEVARERVGCQPLGR
jgi:catalase